MEEVCEPLSYTILLHLFSGIYFFPYVDWIVHPAIQYPPVFNLENNLVPVQ